MRLSFPRGVPRPERRAHPLVLAFGSGLYTGFVPPSGTVGSAVALALCWFLPGMWEWPALLVTVCAVFAAGVPAAAYLERRYGPDPSVVTIDEFVGMWIAVLALPRTPAVAVAAFLLFRAFDIAKPPPARQFDRLRGGFGIMLDDVAAGVYANGILQLAAHVVRVPAFTS